MMVKVSDSSFAYLMQDTMRQMRTLFDRRATRFALTRAQWRALKTIRRSEGLSQSELAELLDMEPIPVGRVIDRLEKTGYIERRADPADRRRWRLHLTASAHAVIAEMEVIAAQLRDEVLHDIRQDEFDVLMRVLGQIKNNLSELERPDQNQQDIR
ncbi:Transcriptional regulator SlyA [Gammaproteobacteria bacterium]|uniref:MarR family winged helix-turn-helix transcriptional regulator n=1 Tax=Dokdonella sp. TaxID=2291710 RepID=UPI001AC5FE5C|nr:MarR family transcriptional regulator [Dokdonella sp.]CAG0982421.1 Transcriptional regulator SlyA [Gammaproteobacteria bacterium]